MNVLLLKETGERMSVMEIKKMGDPVLKQVCKPVDRISKKIKTLIDNMAETMYKNEGVGIAAPQVGVPLRVIVVDVGEHRYDIINPVIVETEGSIIDSEGCLSFPGVYGEVERAEKVKVEYTNRFGKQKYIEADGLLARCLQHEIDHLNGQLFIEIAKSLTSSKNKEEA